MGTTVNYSIKYPAGTVAPNVPLDMQTLAESVDTALTTVNTKFDPAPVTPALLNSWTAFGGGYQALTFYKIGKLVHVTGMIKPGTMTNGIAVATIPTGMLPAALNNQVVGASVGTTYQTTTVAQFSTTGSVMLYGIPASTGYIMFNNVYVTA